MNAGSRLILVSALPEAGAGLGAAACLAIAFSERARRRRGDDPAAATVLFDGSAGGRRRATLLASEPARRVEESLAAGAGAHAAARGALCWVTPGDSGQAVEGLREVIELDQPLDVVAYLPPCDWRRAFDDPMLRPTAVLIRADRAQHASVCALLAGELRERRVAHAIQTTAPGLVASRRALAGIAPGGEAESRAKRLAWRLLGRPDDARPGAAAVGTHAGETGQALPLVLGAIAVVLALAMVAIAIGSASTGAGRVQRAADLAAVSAARSLRDERSRLFEPARLPDGTRNPRALSLARYESDARSGAGRIALEAGIAAPRLRVSFPGDSAGAPTRVTVEVAVELRGGVAGRAARRVDEPIEVEAKATAEAVLGSSGASAGQPASATGDYSGPLAYRQGKPMRPDVAEAFDRMAAAASGDGVALTINSAYRSDAEQAALFAAHPDPQWVAPPGVSLHRCGTELDLGPATAYGWLAANASSFGFVQRYSWEAWHYGFTGDPAPCSQAANEVGRRAARARADGASSATALPSFVPARYRLPIARAASRWNVSAGLLAAQLMAESGFDPSAGSPAGAQGIAQFIPSTAAAYGLDDPFDPFASIEAQAHLMSDNLKRFGSVELALAAYNAGPAPVLACHCVPPYPETQAYVTRILDLMGGSAELVPPALEVRLVA